MAQVSIEYIIMVPVLILQIFLFPLTAAWIMNTWVDSRQTIALRETASHLGSSMQQVYSSINHDTISAGVVKVTLDIPPFIESYSYMGNATLRTAITSDPNSSRVLEITLRLVGTSISTTTLVTFGQNFEWQNSTLTSNSTDSSTAPSIYANKTQDGVIRMRFPIIG